MAQLLIHNGFLFSSSSMCVLELNLANYISALKKESIRLEAANDYYLFRH